jgi:type II secretory pathway component GspD/PulD (secretin)
MTRRCSLALVVVLLSVAVCWGQEAEGAKPPPGAFKQRLREALDKRITFDFVETPLQEAIAFLGQLAQVNIVVDPKVAARKNAPVTLKAKDMPIEQALSWVLKLAELRWEVRDEAIFISDAREEKPGKKGGEEFPGRDKGREMPRLNVRMADGTTIEADMPVLMMPGVGQQILDRLFDPVADGAVVCRLGRDLPGEVDLEKAKALVAQIAPNAKVIVEPALKLLIVTSDQPLELRRVAALVRAVRPEQHPRPPFPPDEEGFMVRKRPFGPDGKPPFGPEGRPFGPKGDKEKPPQEPPGQF